MKKYATLIAAVLLASGLGNYAQAAPGDVLYEHKDQACETDFGQGPSGERYQEFAPVSPLLDRLEIFTKKVDLGNELSYLSEVQLVGPHGRTLASWEGPIYTDGWLSFAPPETLLLKPTKTYKIEVVMEGEYHWFNCAEDIEEGGLYPNGVGGPCLWDCDFMFRTYSTLRSAI